MLVRKFIAAILLVPAIVSISACSNTAKDPQEAEQILTEKKEWRIDEITVNDAITFSEGQMKQQFGSIDFSRYMETVKLEKGGAFTGIFKGETKPFALEWKRTETQITVGAPGQAGKGGVWTIDPQDVSSKSFTMKTQSTAYDYPNVTRIALKFISQ